MLYLIIGVIAVLADQIFKFWITANLNLYDSIPFIPGVMRLTYIRNYGAAFGIMKNMRWLFIVIIVVFAAACVFLLYKKMLKTKVCRVSLAVVLAGAIGNAIDRVIREGGYVVDMFDTEFINFPVFNIADICVVVGGIVFCIAYILTSFNEERGVKPSGQDKA